MFQNKRKSGKYRVFSAVRFYDYDTNLDESLMTNIFDKLSESKQVTLKEFIQEHHGISKEEWKSKILQEYKDFKTDYSAVIFHDKDKLEDGTDKSLHCHIVFRAKNLLSFKSAKEKIMPHNDRKDNFNFVHSEGGSLRYLLHLSEEAIKDKKHRYDIDELYLFLDNKEITDKKEKNEWYSEMISQDFTSDLTQRQRESLKEQEYLNTIKQEISNGFVYPDDVLDILTEQFDLERAVELYTPRLKQQLKLLRETYLNRKQLEAKQGKHNTRLSNIFISAKGGWGKSKFAEEFSKFILDKEGKDHREIFGADSATAQVNTLFSNYENQYISIFNEIEYTMSQAQFCGGFETYSATRNFTNRNKNIYNTSRYCIFTKSDKFDYFSEKIGLNKVKNQFEDKIWQIRRRFDVIIEVEGNYLTISKYKSENEKIVLRRYETFDTKDIINPNEQVKECFEFIYKLCNSNS